MWRDRPVSCSQLTNRFRVVRTRVLAVRFLGVSIALFGLALGVPAIADEANLTVEIVRRDEDLASCPTGAALERAIASRSSSAAVPARVRTEFRRTASGVDVSLTMTSPKAEVLLERTLTAATCEELTEPIALVIALARASASEAPPAPAPAPSPIPAPAPVPEPGPVSDAPQPSPVRGSVGIGPRVYARGPLPALGSAIAVEASFRPWSRLVVLAAGSFAPGAASDNAQAQMSLFGAEALACVELTSSDRVSLSPCGGASVTLLTMRATEGTAVSETNALAGALLAFRGEVVIARPLFVSARLSLGVTPARYQIATCTETHFRSDVVGLDGIVAGGVRFP